VEDDANKPSTPPSDDDCVQSQITFPVVGIGASAGGLQALLRFFENMPAKNGMAFVVVLHLSPDHESSADAIIRRATRMPVIQVTQPVLIEREHVYVIAPNLQLAMIDGFLSLSHLDRPRGAHVAIDIFFRTLAEVHGERAVAIVLSGTGSDGAVGLTRIKEQGGVTIVQSPGDAEHDGMPLAALRTGAVDFELPVTDMPQKLIELWENARNITLPASGDGEAPIAHLSAPECAESAEEALRAIITGLRHNSGHDFQHYKRATVLRRIERRMQVRATPTLTAYSALLDQDAREYDALLADMLISVTNFFRDREAFEALEREIIPELFKEKKSSDEVRVWVAACATGEEAYSVGMLLLDYASELASPPSLQVFASDIDDDAITTARSGIYPSAIITDVPPVRLRQHFNKDGDRYNVRKNVRDRILFAAHNMLRDPPFSRLDLVTCRNFLIYLNREVQIKVLEMFHFALKPGGYLFLGGSESAESVAEFFIPVDKKNRLYRARPTMRTSPYHSQLSGAVRAKPELPALEPQRRDLTYAEIHQRALAELAPPSIILDGDANIVHVSEQAVGFIRMAAGEPSRNVLALIVPELRLELRSALFQVQQGSRAARSRPAPIESGGRSTMFTMQVTAYREAEIDFILVVFEQRDDVHAAGAAESAPRSDDIVLTQLEAELQRVKEQLQETIEHAEVSTEELRASNEELQAINEELRSATEELETSKEELQSVNEELITVNYELKVKVEETSKANDDLNNLIASTDIATVFVDKALRIKRFTPRAADIFRIIPSDIGRSLLDLTHRLEYGQLADDVSSAFQHLRLVEREVRSNDGRCYIVRLLPYRTTEDLIDGAVMTFFDITARREAEEQLHQGEKRMRLVAESTKDFAIITTDAEGRVISWNKGAERMFGYTAEEMKGHVLDCLFVPEDQAANVPAEELRRAREDGRAEDERWHMRKDGSRVYCSGVTTPLGPAAMYGYAKIARDQTDRVLMESERTEALSWEQQSRFDAESAVALKDEFLAIMSHELRHPLNMIQINVELLGRIPEVTQSGAAVRSARQIQTAVASQAKIIDDLLDMSRARTGKLTMAVGPVDLVALVNDIASVAGEDHACAKLDISVRAPATPVTVAADLVRIEQVLMNLVSNAVKFTPNGGTVTLSVSTEDEFARVDVVDTGQGIPAYFLPHVFDMFEQSGSVTTRSKGGLGIGLALVREIVELHGGRVEAASNGIGAGARFSFWLPLQHVSTCPNGGDAGKAGACAEHISVLLVDDSPDMVSAFQALLEMEGMMTHVATSAMEGLSVLKEKKVDLLITDLSMPEVDGFEFLKQVRALPGLAELPAIAVSGLARERDLMRAREAGFRAHLSKPISIDGLFKVISSLNIRQAH
jgi:two-component system CheB/CheR fusion protein